MANETNKIDEIVRLPVIDIVQGNRNSYYLVKCLGRQCRVLMFDWQKSKSKPKTIQCRIVSLNEFGFPIIEQVAESNELNIVEPIKQPVKEVSQEKHLIHHSTDTPQKEDSRLKQKQEQEQDVEVRPLVSFYSEHDFLYYRWAYQSDSFKDWFISTGGIKARLQILIEIARELLNYHRQNKVYKELVPEYIKVEKDEENNLKVRLPETNYYTSGFNDIFIYASHAAPEVVNRRMPNTPMSDCYTFAILAFELLEFCHPFLGDDVLTNNSYEDAFKGHLPWIDNPNDNSNRLVRRYYDRCFITDPLWKLFERTFTVGMYDVFSRPSMYEWLNVLEDEQQMLKFCTNCKTDFLCFDADDECLFCDENLNFDLVVDTAYLTPEFIIDNCRFAEDTLTIDENLVNSNYLNESNPLIVSSRDLMCATDKELDYLSIKVDSSDRHTVRVVIEPLNGASFHVATADLRRYNQVIENATSIPFLRQPNRSLVLSLEDIEFPQRVLILTAIY